MPQAQSALGESGGRLGLSNHLNQLNETVQSYLEQQASDEDEVSEDPIPIPEAYLLYRRLKSWSQDYWTGGWSAQPYLLYEEIDACIAAEKEYERIMEVNRLLEEKAKKGKQ